MATTSDTDKVLYIIRHAEGVHNVLMEYFIRDPPLSERGKEQCRKVDLETKDGLQQQFDLIVTSPLRRALETTLACFPTAIERLGGRKSVLILPQAREVQIYPADIGHDPTELSKENEFAELDFSALVGADPAWLSKDGFYATTDSALSVRARWVRTMLRDRPEKHIVLVTHGMFIKCLMFGRSRGPLMPNCEINKFHFSNDKEATLIPIAGDTPAGMPMPTEADVAARTSGAVAASPQSPGSGPPGSPSRRLSGSSLPELQTHGQINLSNR